MVTPHKISQQTGPNTVVSRLLLLFHRRFCVAASRMTKVVLLLAFATVSLAQFAPSPQPSYGGPNADINIDNSLSRRQIETDSGLPNAIHQEEYYEWEGYDGWYNNPAHPEWGGAGEYSSSLDLAPGARLSSCRAPSENEASKFRKSVYMTTVQKTTVGGTIRWRAARWEQHVRGRG